MAELALIIGTRLANGRFGPHLNAASFIELFREKGEKTVLVDYSPVIERLHEMHKSLNEEQTRNDYNSLYSFWQETKSHDKPYRMQCTPTLTVQANALLTKLKGKLERAKTDGGLTYQIDPYQMYGVHSKIEAFRADAEMYIDALLIYIHSKASADIGSFKRDSILSGYGEFLQKLIQDIYSHILGKGRYGAESFLRFLAFEQPSKLQEHLLLRGQGETPEDFKLRLLGGVKPYTSDDFDSGYPKEIVIRYDNFWDGLTNYLEILKTLLYKIYLINEFLAALKAGNVEWDDDSSSVDELQERLLLLE